MSAPFCGFDDTIPRSGATPPRRPETPHADDSSKRPVSQLMEVSVTDDELRVVLADGRALSVPLAWLPRLLHATSAQRQRFELLGDGEGIHWPDVDEDLSVAGLLPVRRRLSGVSDLMADGSASLLGAKSSFATHEDATDKGNRR